MKTWKESAATSAKITSYSLFALMALLTIEYVALLMAAEIGPFSTVMIAAVAMFAVGILIVRYFSLMQEDVRVERQERAVRFEFREGEESNE